MIYVACHKDCEIPKFVINNKDYTLIKLQDFEFSNKEIKNYVLEDKLNYLNPFLNEITGFQYILDNHLKDDKYIGFCHYRRFFSIKDDSFASVEDINNFMKKCKCAFLAPLWIENTDCLSLNIDAISIRSCNTKYKVIRYIKQLDSSENFYIIFSMIFESICNLYPDYVEDFSTVMNQDSYILYNMFIMEKDYALNYMKWLLDVTNKVATFIYEEDKNRFFNQPRLPGYFAEILFLVWIIHQNRMDKNFNFKYIGEKSFDNNFTLEEILFLNHADGI